MLFVVASMMLLVVAFRLPKNTVGGWVGGWVPTAEAVYETSRIKKREFQGMYCVPFLSLGAWDEFWNKNIEVNVIMSFI